MSFGVFLSLVYVCVYACVCFFLLVLRERERVGEGVSELAKVFVCISRFGTWR